MGGFNSRAWAVPSSAQPLRVSDVRISAPAASSGAPPADTGTTGATQESDVLGLVAGPGCAAAERARLRRRACRRGELAGRVGIRDRHAQRLREGRRFIGGVRRRAAGLRGWRSAFRDRGRGQRGLQPVGDSPSIEQPGSVSQRRTTRGRGGLRGYRAEHPVRAGRRAAARRYAVRLYRLSGGTGGTGQLFPSPQVLCSGLGATTNGTALTRHRKLQHTASLLAAGDRLEIRLDLEHQGATSGFRISTFTGAAPAS